jgi:hypothetical protein
MKSIVKRLLTILSAGAISALAVPSVAVGALPDIPGFLTLHCDLHIHTVFSDGEVWPTIRVREARAEGLDCIAITDHLKFGKHSKYPEITGDRNRSFEIAAEAATGTDLIVIRGVEITQGMPPGHINALFLQDNEIAREDHFDTIETARAQGAFLFWNHPGWKSPDKEFEQDGIARWFEDHDRLFGDGTLRGIEVVNGRGYSTEAHQWAIDRGLTLLGNSDIHRLTAHEYDLASEHRPQTLVFAKARTAEAVREALFERRTAVWYGNELIGDPQYLGPLFNACVSVDDTAYLERLAVAVLTNHCDIDFFAENLGPFTLYSATRFLTFGAGRETILAVKTGTVLDTFTLDLSVKNLHTAPDAFLRVSLGFEPAGAEMDRDRFRSMTSD